MEMRNYSIPREILNKILNYQKLKVLIYHNIQTNKDFLKYTNIKQKQKTKDKSNNIISYINESSFMSKAKLNYNIIQPMKNNYIQNPEYSLFKSKRESFRKENILLCLRKLNMEISDKEIYQENQEKLEDSIHKETNSKIFFLFLIDNENKKNCEELSPLEKIQNIINNDIVKEYIPKTFKIIIKEKEE